MGIYIQKLRDHLCNHVSGLSSREQPELVSMEIGFNPSECLRDTRTIPVLTRVLGLREKHKFKGMPA